jgi:hypothetical protein
LFGLKKKESKNIIYVKTDTDNIETNAMKLLEVAKTIKWGNPLTTKITKV